MKNTLFMPWRNLLGCVLIIISTITNSIGLVAQSPINISTGLTTGIGLPDPSWIVTPTGGFAITVPSYAPYWQTTPITATGARWINRTGSIDGQTVGEPVYDRLIRVPSGINALTLSFSIAYDDDIVSVDIIDPTGMTVENLAPSVIRSTTPTAYYLSNVINRTYTCPKQGDWIFRVKLKFLDEVGAFMLSGTATMTEGVCQSNCKAGFNFAASSNCGNYQFTNASTGTGLTYSWNFGDPTSASNTSTAVNPTHQFSGCGTFNVCLLVTGPNNCRDSICKRITINDAPPRVNCPANLTIACASDTVPSVTGRPILTNGCSSATMTYVDNIFTSTQFCKRIQRTWTITGGCGNSTTCVQSITVVDNTPPTMTCPANITVNCTSDTAVTITGRPTVSDCSRPLLLKYLDVVSGSLPCDGSVQRRWSVTDICGNVTLCTQTITVRDRQTPTITCPNNLTVNTNAGQCYYTGILPQATVIDNCDPAPLIFSSVSVGGVLVPITAATQFQKGVNTIQCFARDQCGQTTPYCSFTLTVVDNQKPTITCPLSISVVGTVTPPSTVCKATITGITPTVSDNCPMTTVNYTVTGATSASGATDASGTIFMQGTSTVTYFVTDMAGNKDSCKFTVKVTCGQNSLDTFCGKAVVTCFSGFINPNNPASGLKPTGDVVAIVDPRALTNTVPNGMDASGTTPMFKNPQWVQSRMGQVFGIAIDGNQDIYVTATTIYGKFGAGTFGSAGSGGIYKIDHLTGNVTDFVTTNAISGSTGSNSIYNIGSGLGNICFDKVRNQFFVTNFSDGKLYRISSTGVVLNTYDHPGSTTFPPTDATYIPLGDRPFGIQINPVNGRLYYSIWREDLGRGSATVSNEVWSIALDGTGNFSGAASCEVQIPPITGQIYSNAPSDLAFSQTGKMLIGERTTGRDFPAFVGNPAHRARVLEYSGLPPFTGGCNAATWGTAKIIYVGNYGGDPVSTNSNCSGGVDYGYGGFDAAQNKPVECDSVIWSTGDALKYSATFNYYPLDFQIVYGLAGMPASGNNNTVPGSSDYVKTSSYYIDMGVPGKTEFGDVEIFKCGCETTPSVNCDSLMVMSRPTPIGDTCCYTIDLKNNLPTAAITKICANLTTSGWIFNTGALLASGWSFDMISPTQLCFKRTTGSIPTGSLANVLKFCLTNTVASPPSVQQIVFDWYDGRNIICKDTIRTTCTAPLPKDTCLVIDSLRAVCLENDLEYCMTFTVKNLNSIPAYGVILGSLPVGFSYSDCGCGGATYGTGGWLFSGFPAIPANGTRTFCVKIISPTPILSPKNICFNASLEFLNQCCTSPKDWCVELKPCCNPCQNSFVKVDSVGQNCCQSIDFVNNCDFGIFTKIDFQILTGGVYYSSHSTTANFCSPPTATYACVTSSSGSVFPSGTSSDIFNFCLTDINMPSEIPQLVRVRYWTTTHDGRDSVACDTTLRFNCSYKKDTCLFVTNERVICNKDSMRYEITVTVLNLAVPTFTATHLGILSDPTITPNPIPFSSPLGYLGTGTVTFFYKPATFPDVDGILPLIYRLKNFTSDSCCNGGQQYIDTLRLPNCDTCNCGTFNISYVNGVNPPVTKRCGDTIILNNPTIAILNFNNSFSCVGNSNTCPDSVRINYTLTGPTGFTPLSSMTLARPTFNISYITSSFTMVGLYTLTMSGTCGTKQCTCKLYFRVDSVCCINRDQFVRNINSAVNVTVNNALCKATVNIGTLPNCDEVSNIQWGDGTTATGPFTAGSMPMHTYTGSGTYIITTLALEKNPATGLICFEYQRRDTIKLVCGGQDSCVCGVFNIGYQLGALASVPKRCGDTIVVNSTVLASISLNNSFACVGNSCPDSVRINWTMTGPTGFSPLSGVSIARPNFTLGLNTAYFPVVGVYTVTMSGTCGVKQCSCKIYFRIDSVCCVNRDQFVRNINSAVNITVNNTLCKATVNIGTLPSCDVIQNIQWGDGAISTGPFGSSTMPMHTYTTSGTYIITTLAIEKNPTHGQICFEYVRRDTIKLTCGGVDTCQCRGFDKMSIFNTGWSPMERVVKCDSTYLLPCVTSGSLFYYHGNFSCSSTACMPDSVTYVITGAGGAILASGRTRLNPLSSLTTGHFDITLNPSLFTSGVNYLITVTGMCGTKVCTCKVNFSFTQCPCPCDGLLADVKKGFKTLGITTAACVKTFMPVGLCPNDRVSWSVTGRGLVGTSIGNATVNVTFGATGVYQVCMTVSRLNPDGTTCATRTICQNVSVICISTGDPLGVLTYCEKRVAGGNIFQNNNFTEGTTSGHLGFDGKAVNWSLFPYTGDGFVAVDNETGASDAGHLLLNGNSSNRVGVYQQVSFANNTYINLEYSVRNYLGSNLPTGTVLEFRLDNAPTPNSNSILIFRDTISRDSAHWTSRSGQLLKGLFSGSGSVSGFLSISLYNNSTTEKSTVGIDNLQFCLSPTVSTNEITGIERFRIVPNPNKGSFTVMLNNPTKLGTKLRIMTPTGQYIQEFTAQSGQPQHDIEATDLPNGMYFLQVISDGKIIGVEKFVKQ